ncbi:MAG: hypothetical protein ACRDTE_05995 [Pseudonocardiaceae bacterium]
MNTLLKLWRAGQLPIRDALYTLSGEAYSVQLNDAAPGGIEILGKFDLDAALADDPDWLSSVGSTKEAEIEDGWGRLLVGEGSDGSDGFFARVDHDNNPQWVFFFTESNPFIDISTGGREATFHSSSGVSVTVDIDQPEAGILG